MTSVDDSLFATMTCVLEAVENGVIVIDGGGSLVYVNARLCDMLGRSRDDLIGTHLYELSGTQSGRSQIDRVIGVAGEPTSAELVVRRSDGTEVSVVVTGRQLSGPPPLHEFRVLTIEDFSSQRVSEDQFREAYKDLARLSDTAIEQAIALKHYSAELEGRVRERTAALNVANMDAIVMLAVASEAKDAETGAHVRRIQHLVRGIARRLTLPKKDVERIGYSSILHDVGKIHIPDRILRKPGSLTENEREIMQTHTLIGEQILSKRPFFDVARKVTRMHHENWDGSGYPDGLAGNKIPIAARIVRTADVFDALTSERVYKPAWPVDQAVSYLKKERDRLFDSEVVGAFVALVSDGELSRLPTSSETQSNSEWT